MDVKKKLVELIGSTEYGNGSLVGKNFQKGFIEKIASNLIANGVTVQDEKPLEAFLHPIDAYKGLKAKYLVFKADTGKVVDNCFILRPDKDAAAAEALRAYAKVTDNETLAKDIYNWVGKGEKAQEWISVKDRLPKMRDDGFVDAFLVTNGNLAHIAYFVDGEWIFTDNGQMKEPMFYDVTHWLCLPQPPKGE